jgi:polysaccharide deacetylase family protein (PEP-CTERM system associated)
MLKTSKGSIGGTRCRYNSTAEELPESAHAGLSIDVEDWFHADNLKRVIRRDTWGLRELRVERNTMRVLEILAARSVRGTFFVLGWVAEKCPQLVRRIANADHEVASHGYGHELVYTLKPSEFREDVLRSKHCLEHLTGKPVRGYRAPSFSITDWAVPILQEVGFVYDSSFVPTIAHDRYGCLKDMSEKSSIAVLRDGFYEVSISCIPVAGQALPWGGGGYFRLVPYWLWLRGVRRIMHLGKPYVFYIHSWEMDPRQPRVDGLDSISRFRHRVNLHRCEDRFAALVSAFKWMPLGELVDQWKMCQETAAHHGIGRD